MADKYFNYNYNHISLKTSLFLNTFVCPYIPTYVPYENYIQYWDVMKNLVIIDFIHIFLVAMRYSPNRQDKNYSYFTYLLITAFGATPSHLLTNLLLGGKWELVVGKYAFLFVLICTLYHYLGFNTPPYIIKILNILSNMSTIVSVYSTVRNVSKMPHSGLGLYLIGCLGGMGGYIYNAIMDKILYRKTWINFDYLFLRLSAISLFWTIIFKSECEIHPHVEAFLIWIVYFVLVIELLLWNVIHKKSTNGRKLKSS